MNPNSVRAVCGVAIGLAWLLGSTLTASAQTTFSVGSGLNVARTLPTPYPVFRGSTTQGVAIQASVGRQYKGRLGWRIDAFASEFDLTQPSDWAGVMCVANPPPGTCCGICPLSNTKGHVGLTGISANQFVGLTPQAFLLGAYLIWGAEVDYFYRHPNAQGTVCLGASAGGGVTLPVGGRLRAFVEARYHGLINAPSQLGWLVPLTAGLRL